MKKKKSIPKKAARSAVAKKKVAKITQDDPVPSVKAMLGIEPLPRGTLPNGGVHPAAYTALYRIKSLPIPDLVLWQEAFASTAISGNQLAEVCSETLHRIMNGKGVSDRYVSCLYVAMFDAVVGACLNATCGKDRERRRRIEKAHNLLLLRRVDKARNLLMIQRHADGATSKMIEEVLRLLDLERKNEHS